MTNPPTAALIQPDRAPSAITPSLRAYSRVFIVAAVSIVVGIIWDISWHRTIGRDTFWTPAHMAIYLGGVLGGGAGGWLILRSSFGANAAERAASIRVWGFHGPLGAWIAVWGALAMLTSAPFDNWWHAAYGLDVRILSPPHSVLALGMWAVVLGALMLVAREQNAGSAGGSTTSPQATELEDRWLFLLASGILLTMAAIFLIEHGFPNQHRSETFYRQSCLAFPIYLLGMARASRSRWAATWIALIYMGLMAGMDWVLPLFPGQPRLGPIYHHVDHFVAMPFPLLLIAPAFALDLVRGWIGHGGAWWRDWLTALACAAVFLTVFLLVQWFFSRFLLSPIADNWFFIGDRQWGYTDTLGPWRQQYWSALNPRNNPPLTLHGVGIAFLCALASARVGLWLGNWMSRVRR
jgi:hypothetical protein